MTDGVVGDDVRLLFEEGGGRGGREELVGFLHDNKIIKNIRM